MCAPRTPCHAALRHPPHGEHILVFPHSAEANSDATRPSIQAKHLFTVLLVGRFVTVLDALFRTRRWGIPLWWQAGGGPLDISELTPEEDIALVGLLREIVQADGNYSDLEREHIHRIKDAIGHDRRGRSARRYAPARMPRSRFPGRSPARGPWPASARCVPRPPSPHACT